MLLLGTGFIVAENFIVKKTPKASQQKLKEQAGNDCADFLHYSAPTIKKIAHIQEFCIKEVDDLIQNNKKGVLHHATKENLAQLHEQIEQLNKALATLHQELDSVCAFIQENKIVVGQTDVKKNK
jgi:uncharacterized protein YukE